ncbi:MAG TPA: phosphate signaling complex protein PhoU [Longimicrobiales bacterium]|nr:phosphate signaling complex protein PhoU [Longimicrobiales bacterium]
MRHFQEGLDDLKSTLVGMAGLAEEQVRKSVRALIDRNTELAQEVVAGDDAIDELEVQVENMAINLLALQQPMARDLRFIMMSLKISNDLERVGDHAENIADAVKYMISAPPFPVLPEVEEMSRLATEMLADSLDAFVRGDAVSAVDVLKRDDRVDELHDNNFRILLTHMMEDPRKITAGMDLLLISGNLERIADLATNICEEVIFLVRGHSVKHHPERREAF